MKQYRIFKNEDETIVPEELLARTEEKGEKGIVVIPRDDLRALLEGAKRYSAIELNGKLTMYENPSGHYLKRRELLTKLKGVRK